jgi:hypothetical protein
MKEEGPLKYTIPLLCLLVLILAACGESTTTASSTPTKPAQPTATPTVAAPGHYKLNETVKIYFAWEITITKASAMDKNTLSSGLEQVPSQPTDKFLILDLSVKNPGIVDKSFDSNQFTLKTSDHQQIKPGPILSDPVKRPPDGTMAAGDTTAGDLVFEVPKTEKSFTLQYEGPPATSKSPDPTLFVWDISIQ